MLDASRTYGGEDAVDRRAEPLRAMPGRGVAGWADEPRFDVAAILRRRLVPLVAATLAGAAVAGAVAWSLPEIYTARAKLVLERRDPSLFEAVPETQRQSLDREAIETELQVIGSREIAARVVDRLDLTRDPFFSADARAIAREGAAEGAGPFGVLVDMGLLETSSLVSARRMVAGWREAVFGAAPRRRLDAATLRESTITSFKGRTDVARQGTSLALVVRATHNEPQAATRVANTMADEYIAATVDARRLATRRAIDFLSERAGKLALQVALSERALVRHRQEHALDDLDAPKRARARLEQLETRRDLLGAGAAAGMAAQLDTEIARLRRQLEERAQAEVKLGQLDRGLVATRERHRLAVERLGNLDLQAEPLNTPARVVSAAQVPTAPTSPKRFLIVAGGGVGAGLLAFMLILVREAGDRRIRSERDLAFSPFPNLANVPEVRTSGWLGRWLGRRAQPHEAAARDPRSFYAHALRNLVVGCRRMTHGAPSWAVLVTSCLPDDGKTALSTALAQACARNGYRTVLVDLDLVKPAMSRAFGVGEGQPLGLRDYLRGACALDETIVPAGTNRRVPAGVDFVRPGDLDATVEADPLSEEAIAQVVAELKSRYDVVVIDSPPAILFDDVGQMAEAADLTLLLLRWGRTDRQTAERAMGKLDWFSETPIATVINRVDPRTRRQAGEVPFDLQAYASYLK